MITIYELCEIKLLFIYVIFYYLLRSLEYECVEFIVYDNSLETLFQVFKKK